MLGNAQNFNLLKRHYECNNLNYPDSILNLLKSDPESYIHTFGENCYLIYHEISKQSLEEVTGYNTLGYIDTDIVVWLELVAISSDKHDSTKDLVACTVDLLNKCKGRYAVIASMTKSLEKYFPMMKRNYFSPFREDAKMYYFVNDESIIHFDNVSAYYRYWLDISPTSVCNLMLFMDCFNSEDSRFQREVNNYLLSVADFESNVTLLELRDHQIEDVLIRSAVYEDHSESDSLVVLAAFEDIADNTGELFAEEKYAIFNEFYIPFLMSFLDFSNRDFKKLKVILKFDEGEHFIENNTPSIKPGGFHYIGGEYYSFTIFKHQQMINSDVAAFD